MNDQSEETANNKLNDGCPDWAVEAIRKIYLLEIEAGSIKNPETSQWTTATQDELLKLAGGLDDSLGVDLEQETATLFERVVRGLTSEDYDPDEIAAMVNARIPTGCNLKYCNASEVLAAM